MRDFSNTFHPDPKPTPKEKKNRKQQWYDMQKRSLEKSKLKKAPQIISDDKFYKEIYKHFKSNDTWYCLECKNQLPNFDLKEDEVSFKIRFHCHHILAK